MAGAESPPIAYDVCGADRRWRDWTDGGTRHLPPKIRDLIAELQRAAFVDRGGKGSHRNFVHAKVAGPVTISGNPNDDAKQYQIRAVRRAIEESHK
jgi:predicted RNA binding protein YcfA (HicA-like mRNA interferase family)